MPVVSRNSPPRSRTVYRVRCGAAQVRKRKENKVLVQTRVLGHRGPCYHLHNIHCGTSSRFDSSSAGASSDLNKASPTTTTVRHGGGFPPSAYQYRRHAWVSQKGREHLEGELGTWGGGRKRGSRYDGSDGDEQTSTGLPHSNFVAIKWVLASRSVRCSTGKRTRPRSAYGSVHYVPASTYGYAPATTWSTSITVKIKLTSTGR